MDLEEEQGARLEEDLKVLLNRSQGDPMQNVSKVFIRQRNGPLSVFIFVHINVIVINLYIIIFKISISTSEKYSTQLLSPLTLNISQKLNFSEKLQHRL